MLEGKRVILRPIRKSDVVNFLRWYNDQEVIQYLSMYLPMTDIAEEKWIEELSTKRKETDIVFVIEVKQGKKRKPIGSCGIHQIDWKNRDAILGMAIGEKSFWSKGYGTEALRLILEYAFEQLNLHRASAAAFDFNERSIKMQLKVGFKREGIVRKALYRNGQYHDKILLGILRKEWEIIIKN